MAKMTPQRSDPQDQGIRGDDGKLGWSILDVPRKLYLNVIGFGLLTYPVEIALSAYLAKQPVVQNALVSGFQVFMRKLGILEELGGPMDAMRLLVFASVVHMVMTYFVTAVLSISGQAMCTGYRNKSPRSTWNSLHGQGLRMFSAHQNMIECFPAFVLAAGLVATVTPPTSTSDNILSLLLLHVFVRNAVYVPAYVLDVDILRTFAFGLSMGAIVSALWEVVTRI